MKTSENLLEYLPRNVILDLLPACIAGEASDESQALVEEYARKDPEIARMLSSGKLNTGEIPGEIPVPDELEMKTMKTIRRSIRRRMWYVAIATASILVIPLAAMMFTTGVNWSLPDFLVMAILLFGTGLTYVLITRISDNIAYRAAVGVAVVAGLLLIWMNLAVGIIGSEDNPANLLYAGVITVIITGARMARLRPQGMAVTMFLAALAQMLVPVIAVSIWRSAMEESPGIRGVFILNAFFTAMFAVSGLLFRYAARKQVAA